MKKAAIPVAQRTDDILPALAALAHNVNMVTGQHQNSPRLAPLEATASTADIIVAINTLIERVQGNA